MTLHTNALSDRDRLRITRHLHRVTTRLLGVRFWLLFSFVFAMALLASGLWLYEWHQFGLEAHSAGLSRREAISLSGARGQSLSSVEADLVRHSNQLEVTSIALVLVVFVPVILLVVRRDALFQARVFRRLESFEQTK